MGWWQSKIERKDNADTPRKTEVLSARKEMVCKHCKEKYVADISQPRWWLGCPACREKA